jgi:hypothetical protein
VPCPGQGPCCVYDLDLSCCLVSGNFPDPCILTDGTPIDQSIIDAAILAASQTLWAVTGRQFSLCQVDIRPCRACPTEVCCPEDGFGYGYGYPWFPVHQADGTWINVSCPCPTQCSCVNLCETPLPYPACSVDQVLIDGVVVDPTTYRIDDFERLVRVPPVSGISPPVSGITNYCWPTCNDLSKPPTEVGTWQITVTYGRPPPELVKLAAAEFACELIKSCLNRPCILPRNVTAVTRQGITEVFSDPSQFLPKGLTGLFLTDLAIRTYNPNQLMQRTLVYSPDVRKKWTRTTWQNSDGTGSKCPVPGSSPGDDMPIHVIVDNCPPCSGSGGDGTDTADDANVTSIPASISTVVVLPSNPDRKGVILFNDSSSTASIQYGSTASTTSFTLELGPNDLHTMQEPIYTGIISAVWTAATGFLRVTEIL